MMLVSIHQYSVLVISGDGVASSAKSGRLPLRSCRMHFIKADKLGIDL